MPEGDFVAEWHWVPRPRSNRRAEEFLAWRATLLSSLRAGHGLGVSFELRLDSGPAPRLAIGCSDPSSARWVTRVLSSAYAGTSWVRRSPPRPDGGVDRFWGRRARAWPDVLREPSDGPSVVQNLLRVMSGLAPGVLVQWSFRPCQASWHGPWNFDAHVPGPRSIDPVSAHGERPFSRRSEPLPPDAIPLFWRSTLSVSESAEDRATDCSSRLVPDALEAALRSRRGNGVRLSRSHFDRLPWNRWFPVSEEELGCILPGVDEGSGIDETIEVAGLPVLPLGRSSAGKVVGPPVEPWQGRHLAVLGETGMGKSSTLIAFARKASTLGGVVLFDPLGETARAFSSGLSERDRSRLIWVSPRARASSINALEGIGPAEGDPVLSDRKLNDLVHALRRVRSGRYVDSAYWGPRLEEMLTRALLAAATFSSGTLEDAHTLLATGGRTRQVVPAEAREAVRDLSDRIRERPDDAEGARRLLYEVVRSPVLGRMLCDREPALHTKELVEPGRIAVIAGDAASVGESVARYLLAVYLALVWSELLARPSPAKTFVVLDESQWFSHESLAEMLRLARRRNVHVVLATQTISSLPDAVAEAVWTNVSDFVAFRGSPEEARELSRATHGLSVEEILALPRGQAVALLGKGASVLRLRSAGRPPEPEPASPDGSGGSPGSTSPRRGPPGPQSTSRDMTEVVLDWILARSPDDSRNASVRVDLTELRRSVDPEGQAVREAGAQLSRAGALVARERSGGGSVWVIDPQRIPRPSADGRPSPDTRTAESSHIP